MESVDHHFMRLAIDEGWKCELDRPDAPRVGAVVALDGEVVGSAYRGRDEGGQHAEFTLLHLELGSTALTRGATLYTTLEPCTTRSHNKRTCVKWVVEKKISRVVIGLLDPNPNILGRGYWTLIEAGIEVELFSPEFVGELREQSRAFLKAHRGKLALSLEFHRAILRRKSARTSPYPVLGWQDALSIQDCPNLREGWLLSTVTVVESPDHYQLEEPLRDSYAKWVENNWEKYLLWDDGEKFALHRNPAAFSDAPSLRLEVFKNLFSEAKFYQEERSSLEKVQDIENFVRGSLTATFPQALCMHIVVATSDRQLLLTRRSKKVAWHTGTWSVSIEEQMKEEDLSSDEPTVTVLRSHPSLRLGQSWIDRASCQPNTG